MSGMEDKKYKLKELLTIKNGKDHKPLAEGDYPVYGSGGYMRSVNSFLYDRTSILLPRKGTLSNIQYVSGKPFWTVDTIYYTVLNENLYDPYYLFLYLNALDLSGYDSGASIPSMTSKTYYSLNVELPEKKLQAKVANIIRAYDNLIENNNKRIKLLEQIAENLYKEWFVRFRFPGYEDVDLENGLPKEWEYTKLERLANISTGKCNREDAEEDGAYPLFDRSQEIKRSNVWLKDCEAIIVPGEGTSFIPRYYNGKFNLHQRCYCVEPLEKGMGFFLYQTLMMYRIYFLYVATGATVPSLRLNNFNDFKVLLPKKELCFKYNEIAEKINDEILLLKNKNELLSKQRDMLLPRLMSGKLEV